MLLLFDVNGTLLEGTTPLVAAAMRAALSEVHGVDTRLIRMRVETAGRTDGEIARAILLDAGVSAERIDGFAEACARADGVLCVAVASGSFTSDALAAADVVVRDADELRLVLPDLGIGPH